MYRMRNLWAPNTSHWPRKYQSDRLGDARAWTREGVKLGVDAGKSSESSDEVLSTSIQLEVLALSSGHDSERKNRVAPSWALALPLTGIGEGRRFSGSVRPQTRGGQYNLGVARARTQGSAKRFATPACSRRSRHANRRGLGGSEAVAKGQPEFVGSNSILMPGAGTLHVDGGTVAPRSQAPSTDPLPAQDTGAPAAALSRHFFHFGEPFDSAIEGAPLVCLNGGLMADTGSEAMSYIYECQNRYPVYAAFAGLRCLLFIRDDESMSGYETRLSRVDRLLDTISNSTGFTLAEKVIAPLFMTCDLDTLQSGFPPKQDLLLRHTGPGQVVNEHVLGGAYLNQCSPTISKLLAEFYASLSVRGYQHAARLDEYRAIGDLALAFHDKSAYWELVAGHSSSDSIPDHVPTAIIDSSGLADLTWDQLVGALAARYPNLASYGSYCIKSALDADGEVNEVCTRSNFSEMKASLLEQLAAKTSEMGRTESSVRLLVQPQIHRSATPRGLPSSVGVTYYIEDPQSIKRIVVAGHVYEDVGRKTFIGSYLSDELTAHVLETIKEERILALLQLFAARGYRGPINLDAMRAADGRYLFIYDCNPRMGGSLPTLLLKAALEREGLSAETVLTFGYRGRTVYPNLRRKLRELAGNDLLYTRAHQRGAYLVPSLVRPNGFDITLINMTAEESEAFIGAGFIGSLSDEAQSDLSGVYW